MAWAAFIILIRPRLFLIWFRLSHPVSSTAWIRYHLEDSICSFASKCFGLLVNSLGLGSCSVSLSPQVVGFHAPSLCWSADDSCQEQKVLCFIFFYLSYFSCFSLDYYYFSWCLFFCYHQFSVKWKESAKENCLRDYWEFDYYCPAVALRQVCLINSPFSNIITKYRTIGQVTK